MTWRDRAACAGSTVDFFDHNQINQALMICHGCPVVDDCLADAVETGSTEGVRGGVAFNAEGKPSKRQEPKPRKPATSQRTGGNYCGTTTGHTMHQKRGEEPCATCKKARNDYLIEWRAKRKRAAA